MDAVSARAAPPPLGEHERPPALIVAVLVAVALTVATLVSVLTVHDLSRHGGSLPGGLFLACVLLALANGMYRRRYWAVLGFEALLAFQIIVTSLALVVAETLLAAGLCALSILLAGWLFWKLVRVMGRIQASERPAPTHESEVPGAYTGAEVAEPGAQVAEPGAQVAEPGAQVAEPDTDEALR